MFDSPFVVTVSMGWDGCCAVAGACAVRPGSEFGCSSTREGSGVSGCLQRRERIADAAKPTVKRRRLRGLTVSSFGSDHFLSHLGAGVFYLRAEGVGQHSKHRSGTRRG